MDENLQRAKQNSKLFSVYLFKMQKFDILIDLFCICVCSLVLFTRSSSCRFTERRSFTYEFAVTARHEGNHEYCFDAMTLRGRKIERDSRSHLRMTLREISVVLDVKGPWHQVMDHDERWRARLAFDGKIPSKGADYHQQPFSYACVFYVMHTRGGEGRKGNL